MNQMKEQVSRAECERILDDDDSEMRAHYPVSAVLLKRLARAHLELLDLQDKRRDAIAEALGCLSVIAKGGHETVAKDLAAIGIAEIHKLSMGENITPRQALLDECDSLRRDKERLDWLESLKAPSISQFGNGWWQLFEKGVQYKAAFLREALDQAMKVNEEGREMDAVPQ